ncbi:MAG: Rieske (2Fe-2S) protein [Planctomycetaceae bacterium]
MPNFTTVATIGDIPLGEGRAYPVNGRMVAVFHLEDGYHAIDDSCPHMGASLAGGYVEDGAVMCPWHAWRFCVNTGCWLDSPKSPLRAAPYEVRINGDQVQVAVPDKVAPPPGLAADDAPPPEGT